MKRDTGARMAAPILGAALISVVGLPVAIITIGHAAGGEGAQREARLVSSGFSGFLLQTTVQHGDRLERSAETSGVYEDDRTVRFDRDGRPLYLASKPTAAPAPDSVLLAAARSAVHTPASVESNSPYSTSLVWIDGAPELVVSAPMADGGHLVGFTHLGPDLLNDFGARMGLTDIKIEPKGVRPTETRNAAPLRIDGSGQGSVTWQSQNVGQMVVGRIMPWMAPAVLILIAAGIWLFYRTRRLAQSLIVSEAHAHHLALHDPLTGLANRTLFSSRLDLAIEQRRRSGGVVAVFVVDLDRFKQVNDSLGHHAGDELIRQAGQRLTSICRSTDTVSRLGGDEFAVVAHLPNEDALKIMVERAAEALSGPIDLPGGKSEIRASIGVAVIADETTDALEATRQADLAMYRAKELGRGRYALFEAEMDEGRRLRMSTEADLRAALAAGDLAVHYQPQFLARSGKLESVEALVRWEHRERGAISPAFFIPIAEESGLIHELGEMVLRQACVDAKRWPNLKVAVNISPMQLRQANFVATCRRILRETGIEPNQIELEITEGVLLEDDARTQSSLKQLRELGFKLALDDFGTGYSSLSYLTAYPVDKIKIDRSFISQLGVQADSEKVIKAIVRLGRALGVQVTAEGVETETQRTELVAAGCNVLQGYLGGRPGEAGTVDALIKAEGRGHQAA